MFLARGLAEGEEAKGDGEEQHSRAEPDSAANEDQGRAARVIKLEPAQPSVPSAGPGFNLLRRRRNNAPNESQEDLPENEEIDVSRVRGRTRSEDVAMRGGGPLLGVEVPRRGRRRGWWASGAAAQRRGFQLFGIRLRRRPTLLSLFLLIVGLFLLSLAPLIWRVFRLQSREGRDIAKRKDQSAGDAGEDYSALDFRDRPVVSAETCQRVWAPPLVSAHGGDTTRAPPNTLAAYQFAADAGAQGVEVDASRTADGVLVALHDRDVQLHAGRPELKIGSMSYKEVQGACVGRSGNSSAASEKQPGVILLRRALQALVSKFKLITVDVKVAPGQSKEELARDILVEVKAAGCAQCLVWCKDDDVVAHVAQMEPSTKAGYIVMRDFSSGQVSGLLRMREPRVVAVAKELVTSSMVAQLHRESKEVHVWTVDDLKYMHRMIELGVDAVVTGQPRRFRRAVAKHQKLCSDAGFIYSR